MDAFFISILSLKVHIILFLQHRMGASSSSSSNSLASSRVSSNNPQERRLQINFYENSIIPQPKFYSKDAFEDLLGLRLGAFYQFGDKTQKVTQLEFYKHKLNPWQLSCYFMHHQYCIFQTADKKWWSLQKNDQSILIQKSLNKKDVVDKIDNDKRTTLPWCSKRQDMEFKDIRLLDVLEFTSKRIQTYYDIAQSNCQHFAEEIRKVLLKK